jgi:hypothetical protein
MTAPRRSSFVLAAGALALLAAAWVGRHSRSPAHGSAATADVQEMADELASLRDRVARLEESQRADGQRMAAMLSGAKAQPPSAAPQAAPAGDEPPMEKKHATVASVLGERVENEEIDSAWSGPTLGRIRSVIQNTLPRYEVVDASCASTLCRVVLRTPRGADPAEVGNKLPDVAPFDRGTSMYVDTSGETPVTTIFVTRDGRPPWEGAAL